jgi:hypothetical protein
MGALNGFDVIVNTVNAYPENPTIRSAALELIALLSNDRIVQEKVAQLVRYTQQMQKSILGSDDMTKVSRLVTTIGTLAFMPSNAERIVNAGGIQAMVAMMEVWSSSMGDAQTEVLAYLSSALNEVSQ